MRILIFGATGQVGHALCERLGLMGELILATHDGGMVAGRTSRAVDLREVATIDKTITALHKQGPLDMIINAAAYTQVDRAEEDEDSAHSVNAVAPTVMATVARRLGAEFIHYSTDYVFDGQASDPYREEDPTHALGVYGATKLKGETGVLNANPEALILRTCWVYSWRGNNFLLTMLKHARAGNPLKVVNDQFGTPTSATAIADMTRQVCIRKRVAPSDDMQGVFHLSCAGHCTWYDFAAAIFDGAVQRGLLHAKPILKPIPSSEYPTPAARPAWSVLETSRLEQVFSVKPPTWEAALERVLNRLAKQWTGATPVLGDM